MDNEKIQPTKLDIILKKKQYLDESIKACEIRIDEKLASLVEEGIISREMNPDLFDTNFQNLEQPADDHFLSGIDISDDDALDQAVRNSRPFDNRGNQLAFSGDELLIEKAPRSQAVFDTPAFVEDEDEELPTLSKILGRTASLDEELLKAPPIGPTELKAELPTLQPEPSELFVSGFDQAEVFENPPPAAGEFVLAPDQTGIFEKAPPAADEFVLAPDQTGISEKAPPAADEFVLATDQTDLPEPGIAAPEALSGGGEALEPPLTEPTAAVQESATKSKRATRKQSKAVPPKKQPVRAKKEKSAIPKPNITAMILPSLFFIAGLALFGIFLTLAAQTFNFVDYSVLFILFTCLIFTIALPFSASIFFMILLLLSYIALSLISVFYLGVPFELYQIGWMVIIPLLLSSSTILIKKVRELFEFKKSLERHIAAYDNLEESPGLTIEKAHYKDLKYAMERAAKGETILTLEMIAISHLDTLNSINGSRLWDEILYKTMKIIKQHCYNTHLIYILDGHIFSIIMENTSVKNQLLINQGITEAFNALISEYDVIDEAVKLNIAPVPYSRDIASPFDYRTLGLRHLNNSQN